MPNNHVVDGGQRLRRQPREPVLERIVLGYRMAVTVARSSGLFNMASNAAEWVDDCWKHSDRGPARRFRVHEQTMGAARIAGGFDLRAR